MPTETMRIPISALINEDSKAEPPMQPQQLPFIRLHGREYFVWNGRVHPHPWDENQRDLLDILHTFIYDSALENRLHTVQLQSPKPLRILDVGYGTGHWTIDMARTYPTAQVTGFDLVPFDITTYADTIHNMAPVDFTQNDWPIPVKSQDLIHMALLAGNVPDWERMYRTAYKYLRPATGQIEHIEIDFTPQSHPHPYPAHLSPSIQKWWELSTIASSRTGTPLQLPSDLPSILQKVGYVDISHRKIDIPFAGNAKQPYQQRLSDWFRAAMAQLPRQDNEEVANSFAGISAFWLASELGMGQSEIDRLCEDVVREVNRRGTVLYCTLNIYTARKPPFPQEYHQIPTPVTSPSPSNATDWVIGGRSQKTRSSAHM